MPLARPSAWHLWWSFTWCQAAAMVLSMIALGIILGALKCLGMPPRYGVDAIPYLTLVILVYSSYEACRRLLSVYDIRLRGAHSGEQDNRHRR